MARSKQPPDFDALHRELFDITSERGAVIGAGAMIESCLFHLIDGELLPADKSNRHLGDFATMIRFAYRLGLIDDGIRRWLDQFRELRNDFAHSPSPGGLSADNAATLQKLYNAWYGERDNHASHSYDPIGKLVVMAWAVVTEMQSFQTERDWLREHSREESPKPHPRMIALKW